MAADKNGMKTRIHYKDLKYPEFLHRENNFAHYSHNDDMAQYEYLKSGDPKALEEIRRGQEYEN